MLIQVYNTSLEIKGIPSIGTDNLCGFASLVLPFNAIISQPRAFFGDDQYSPNNPFLKMYTQALLAKDGRKITIAELLRELSQKSIEAQQTFCAPVIKQIFVEQMLQDKSDATPFDKVLEIVLINFLNPGETQLHDYSDFIKDFTSRNEFEINLARAEFVSLIENEGQLNQAEKANAITDSSRFVRFLRAEYPAFIEDLKQYYCDQILITPYRAREIDLVYIADQTDAFKGITVINKPNRSVSPQILNEDRTIVLEVINYGNHWEAVRLPIQNMPKTTVPVNQKRTPKRPLFSDSLFFVFGENWYTNEELLFNISNPDSEVAKIAMQGDAYIAATTRANELLDSNNPEDMIELEKLFKSIGCNQF